MAYPGEQKHVDYLAYLEQHALGSSEQGLPLTKEQWLKLIDEQAKVAESDRGLIRWGQKSSP